MAKLLLVEDDRALSVFLRESLGSRQHEVDHVTNGTDGLHWLQNGVYAAAIVDWELPGMSGIDLCRCYRDKGGSTPILMLTGKAQLKDKVVGLDSGADDYLAKPFELDELHARLRALLRRKASYEPQSVIYGEIDFNATAGEVLVAGKKLELTRTEFGILELLLHNIGHTVKTGAILDCVWSSESESSADAVRYHMTKLRKKLSSLSKAAGESIKTVYGVGYRIEKLSD